MLVLDIPAALLKLYHNHLYSKHPHILSILTSRAYNPNYQYQMHIGGLSSLLSVGKSDDTGDSGE